MIETYRTWRLLREFRKNVRRPFTEMEKFQERRLCETVVHAFERVPFYRRVWREAGFDPSHFTGIKDLGRIPVIGSATIKEAARRGELLADGVDTSDCTYLDSSGSSGQSLRIWKRSLEERVRRAVGLHIWFERGFRWHHTTAQFQILPGPSHPLQRFGISRKVWISTAKPIQEQLDLFLSSQADVLVGTTTGLRRIAQAVEASGQTLKRPRIILCAGELIDAESRSILQRVFDVDPSAIYGQTEVGYVAWQCEQRDAFHLNADTHLVEVLRDGHRVGPGELGTIVITDLRGRAMPLIRYDTSDLARPADGPCPCGRTLPTLASIEGRAKSSIIQPDGQVLTTRTILDAMNGVLPIGSYRLFQEASKRFRLERLDAVPKASDLTIPNEEAIHRQLQELLGPEELTMVTVDSWPDDGTGKTHAVWTKLELPGLS